MPSRPEIINTHHRQFCNELVYSGWQKGALLKQQSSEELRMGRKGEAHKMKKQSEEETIGGGVSQASKKHDERHEEGSKRILSRNSVFACLRTSYLQNFSTLYMFFSSFL